jgi:hypothetical protein
MTATNTAALLLNRPFNFIKSPFMSVSKKKYMIGDDTIACNGKSYREVNTAG